MISWAVEVEFFYIIIWTPTKMYWTNEEPWTTFSTMTHFSISSQIFPDHPTMTTSTSMSTSWSTPPPIPKNLNSNKLPWENSQIPLLKIPFSSPSIPVDQLLKSSLSFRLWLRWWLKFMRRGRRRASSPRMCASTSAKRQSKWSKRTPMAKSWASSARSIRSKKKNLWPI